MRISDWSSDVCSSDLSVVQGFEVAEVIHRSSPLVRLVGGINVCRNGDRAVAVDVDQPLRIAVLLVRFLNLGRVRAVEVERLSDQNWRVLREANQRPIAGTCGEGVRRAERFGSVRESAEVAS